MQKVVAALVKASHFIQTKTPEEIAAAVPADLVGDRAQYIETVRASKEIFAPTGLVTPGGVETVVKVLDSFAVFKPGQKVDVGSTYDMTFVRQAMKDLKTRGLEQLDLGGVNTQSGAGIARFKLETGGQVLKRAGSYV